MNEMRKLMEMVQLDEYERTEPIYTEYRDPDGDFVVKYRASRGYYVEGEGADSAPSFESLDDAIEHGELSVMSYDDAIEEDVSEGERGNNISKITRLLLAEHNEKVSNILTDKLRGQTVTLNVLGKFDGMSMDWKVITVKVDHVIYNARDVDGPIYVTSDGQKYHSHPDHDVRVIK